MKAEDILKLEPTPTLDELLDFIHDDDQLPTPELMLLWWMEENDDGTPDGPLSCLYRHLKDRRSTSENSAGTTP